MSKKASDMVGSQIIDFGFAKSAPAKVEREERPVTLQGRYDKDTGMYWIGFKSTEVRPSHKTMIVFETDGAEKTSLCAPNDKGETVNIIAALRVMVPMSKAWADKQKKAEKGE